MAGDDLGTSLLECDGLSKIVCDEFKQRRKYVLADMLLGAPRHDRLRRHERFALRGFSVRVKGGENIVVLGLSGAGKSTVARLVTQMSRPDAGSVGVHGRVGLVFNGKLGMNPFLTADEYVRLAAAIHGAERDVADTCCDEALELTGLTSRRHAPLVDLPRGDVRYLSLAVSLVVPQDLRVFDDLPRLGHDAVGSRVAARIGEIFARGSNLILSSTTAGLPSTVSHAIILHEGETLYQGLAETVVPIYDHFTGRMERIRRADEARHSEETPPRGVPDETDTEGDAGPVLVDVQSPAELIMRAVRRLDPSHIGSLAEDQVAQMWASDQPIILGPFLADVALELLYWRPFVAWMRATFGPRRAPVIAVSRGRVGEWYAGLASDYVDLCDLLPFDIVHTRNLDRIREGGTSKQTVISDFERDLLDLVTKHSGTANAAVLHPSVLFRVCSKIWRGVVPGHWLSEHARYERFSVTPDPTPMAEAAEPYVAASFWFSACFPDTTLQRRVVHEVLAELSQRAHVVVVDAGGFPGVPDGIPNGGRIRVLAAAQVDDQLRAQATVIAGARAFVGTFGGLSLMAPFYNVPTCLLFGAEAGLFPQHAAVSREVAAAMPGLPFELTNTSDFDPAHLRAWVDPLLS